LADVSVDFLVIGSGLAGLTYALRVAPHGSVALLTKKTRTDANSSWAQGGIAGVLADDDSFELHKQDTLVAGAGLCNEEAVAVLVHEGPERIRDLIKLGASFNRELDAQGQNVLSLGREGGHSRNRIVHTADYTGWECERTLLDAVKARPEIAVYEHYFVTDLEIATGPDGPACLGANALDVETGEIQAFRARATLLATGGCGQVYLHTTNPPVATGDGVAMAWRAGAAVANMEFIQFHPTTLFHPDARAFLITEALRGEGGILRHEDGERFMDRYHPLAELAPRDIVARAIVSEMKRRSVSHVVLDVTHLDPEFLRSHFPTVYERCLSVGIDITRTPIPIVPAQHYQCGGVVTDLHGATGIARLYAAGEAAMTGVHGANRLASNSLLEAMVFGQRAADHSLVFSPRTRFPQSDLPPTLSGERDLPPNPSRKREGAILDSPPSRLREGGRGVRFGEGTPDFREGAGGSGAIVGRADIRRAAQELMARAAGIVRTTEELEAARAQMRVFLERLNAEPACSVEDWEALNAVQVGLLIVESALQRHESRGLHYTLDYPEPVESERHDTVLRSWLPVSDGR